MAQWLAWQAWARTEKREGETNPELCFKTNC